MRYSFLDKNIKANNIIEFAPNDAEKMILAFGQNVVPEDATEVFVHGVLRGSDEVIKQCIDRKIPWFYMDNAGHYFPEMYKRIVINATAPTTFREGRRFEHNTVLDSWRGGQGNKILVLPPSPPYMDVFFLRDFLNHIVHNVNVYTGKDIVVRGKPAKGRKARPLQEQLDEAYCVITWGSAIALEAVRQGIPTISLGWCPAKLCSFQLEDLETNKMLEEPPRMECFDNLTWSSFRRNELSLAYETVVENSLCKTL